MNNLWLVTQKNFISPKNFQKYRNNFQNIINNNSSIKSNLKSGNSLLLVKPEYIKSQIFKWNSYMHPIIPFYAVKSFPDNKICQELNNFDCASAGEINQILNLNKDPKNIIYANTCKRPGEIQYAIDNKVNTFTVDSQEECEKIFEISQDVNIILRLAINESNDCITKFSNKFGISTKEEFTKIIDYAVFYNLHSIKGFSFHVGSGQQDPKAYSNALERIEFYMNILKSKYPKIYKNINTIDIGGGFSDTTNLQQIKSSIQPYILKYNTFKWFAEPGRYFSENSADLICPIILKKYKNNKPIIVIPNSVYHSFSCKFFDGKNFDFIKNHEQEDFEEGMIVGDTCDGIDIIYEGLIPKEINNSSYMIFPNMGAYTYSSSSNFNGFKPPEHIYL